MGKVNDIKKIDIHGMLVAEAKKKIDREIATAPSQIKRLVIIHGCNNGTALRDMVRTRIKSPRIEGIVPTFANDGETTIYLK